MYIYIYTHTSLYISICARPSQNPWTFILQAWGSIAGHKPCNGGAWPHDLRQHSWTLGLGRGQVFDIGVGPCSLSPLASLRLLPPRCICCRQIWQCSINQSPQLHPKLDFPTKKICSTLGAQKIAKIASKSPLKSTRLHGDSADRTPSGPKIPNHNLLGTWIASKSNCNTQSDYVHAKLSQICRIFESQLRTILCKYLFLMPLLKFQSFSLQSQIAESRDFVTLRSKLV